VSDELADLDCVHEVLFARRAAPSLNACNGWLLVKRCVDLDGIEALQVVVEPFWLRHFGIKRIPPFPVTLTGASYIN
jgi:hypothetical protein